MDLSQISPGLQASLGSWLVAIATGAGKGLPGQAPPAKAPLPPHSVSLRNWILAGLEY